MNKRLRMASAVLVLSGALSLPAVPAAAQGVEGLVNVRFQLDVRLFAVMSALNAAGFDLDADLLEQNATRKLVRERVAAPPGDLRYRLREFYRSAAEGLTPEIAQSKFVSYSLLLNGPPGFELSFKPEEVPEDARSVIGFERLVAELWREAGLAELWKTITPQYVAEMEAYRPVLRDLIIDVLRYMRTEARIALDREVAFVPDLLNGYAVVNARNVGNRYIVVVGPSRSPEKPLRSLRHEYLHFLLDPLIAKHRAALPAAQPFVARAGGLPSSLPRYHNDFMLLMTESLIRTVELRIEGGGGAGIRAGLLRLYDEGLILGPYFSEALQKFEGGSEAMQEFFPELMRGIRWETESARAAEIESWRREAAAAAGPVHGPVQTQKGRLSVLVAEANRLLLARQFDAAAPVLRDALALDPANANALFGLGQLAAQAQEFDRALDLYGRAAANAGRGESWIAAWSYVRRGNIFGFRDERDKARAEWNRVLQMDGDLHGALEAAQKALEEQ